MKVNGALTMNDPMPNHVEGMQGVSILYGFDLKKRNNDELVAMVTRGAINDKTKSFVETRNGGSSFINQGSDLLADLDLSGGEDKDKGKYRLWAILNHGNMRQESGSHVNTHGWNLAVGWAREDKVNVGKRLFSPFVEYGRGSYSSLLDDDTYGSGKFSYLGVGVIGRIERKDGAYIEGAIHGGKMLSDYTGNILPGMISTYDSSNPYYAAHLAVGKALTMKNGDTLTPYFKYFWSHQNGMKAQLNTGEEYDFSSVDSHRLRVGAKYRHHQDEDRTLYAGLAFEYELGGGARATYQGFDTPSTSMRGASAMLEFGYRFTPKKGRLSYDLHLTGWQGKRRGFMGTAQVTWAF